MFYKKGRFLPNLGQKKLFFRNKNIYHCKRHKNGAYIYIHQISSFYDKNCGLQSLYRWTDRNMKTKRPIVVMLPCLASFKLDIKWFNNFSVSSQAIVVMDMGLQLLEQVVSDSQRKVWCTMSPNWNALMSKDFGKTV